MFMTYCLFFSFIWALSGGVFHQEHVDSEFQSLNTRQLLQDAACKDQSPPGATFECTVYAQMNLCSELKQQYCQQSCGKCGGLTCQDVLFPGIEDCDTILSLGQCGSDLVRGQFCNITCGNCPKELLIPISAVPAQTPFLAPTFEGPAPTPAVLSVPGSCDSAEDLQCDTDALLSFKKGVTRGVDLLKTWSGENPCRWRFVTCDKVDGINDRVVDIDMDFYRDLNEYTLSGVMVPEFSKLRYLNEFRLGALNISGSLHTEYSTLDRLQEFLLFKLELTGTIPPQYSVWSLMEYFQVRENQLSGTLPPQLSEWKLTESFLAPQNKLSGVIPPEYSEWQNLELFYVFINQLSGTVPAQFSTWKDCETISMAENTLSGSLPVEYSELSLLQNAQFTINQLSGTFPVEFSTWRFCTTFLFNENFMSGVLPEEYSQFSRIEKFYTQQNRLSGTLPIQLSEWGDCTSFRAYDNRFSGTLPPEYSEMKFIEDFWVGDNSFLSGTLPAQYSSMRFLDFWYSQNTKIDSNVPIEWSVFSPLAKISV